MQNAKIYKAVSLSSQAYMKPKTYVWRNKDAHYIRRKHINCFVTPCQDTNTLYVVFKGTTNCEDLLLGVSSLVTLKHRILHTGYLNEYIHAHSHISRVIDKELAKHKHISEVVFTGHSAGAAYSASASLVHQLLTNLKDKANFSCITFGSPVVLTKSYQDYFKNNITHLSIEHVFDPIPLVPLHMDFVGLPNKLVISSPNDICFDIIYNHSMTNYMKIIEDMNVACDTTTFPASCSITKQERLVRVSHDKTSR